MATSPSARASSEHDARSLVRPAPARLTTAAISPSAVRPGELPVRGVAAPEFPPSRLDAALLDAAGRLRRCRPGETIIHEGDPGGSLVLVRSGIVRECRYGPRSSQLTLLAHHATAVVGIAAALDPGAVHATSFVSVNDTALRLIDRSEVQRLRAQLPWFEGALQSRLLVDYERLARRCAELSAFDAQSRVASSLVELAGPLTTVATTQDVVASGAGIARPTANTELRRLEEAGVLVLTRGRIQILDRAALEQLRD
jgi:CRP/FNR family transcriptional regulator, cyclic AMP receptor protein